MDSSFLLRKVVHIVTGIILLAGLWIGWDRYGMEATRWIVVLIAGVVVVIELVRIEFGWFPWIGHLFKEKEKLSFASGTYVLFLVIVLMSLFSREIVFGVLGISIVGDVAAALVGRAIGRHTCPWNLEKSWEGFFAYAVAGTAAGFFFLGWTAALLAVVAALLEMSVSKIEDNFVIPFLVALLAFWLG